MHNGISFSRSNILRALRGFDVYVFPRRRCKRGKALLTTLFLFLASTTQGKSTDAPIRFGFGNAGYLLSLPSSEKSSDASPATPTEAFAPPRQSDESPREHSLPSAQNNENGPFRSSNAWQFLLIPSLNYTSDEGLGAGLTFTLFRKDDGAALLREELRLRLFMTSKFSHRHEISWNLRNVGNLPVRLQTRVGFFSTRSAHFCGLGPNVTCAERDAWVAYRALLQEDAPQAPAPVSPLEEFTEQYYLRRYFSPYFRFLVLWKAVRSWPVELIFGWNLAHQQPGTLFEQSPSPYTRYAEIFPTGEAGRHSTLRVGFLSEDVDLDAWPSRGHRMLLLARAADVWSGSSWQFFGLYADLIGYFRFPKGTSNVLVLRVLYDEIHGEAPSLELSQVTGLEEVSAFGGPQLGRGIRERRFNGQQKRIHQGEYRVPCATFRIQHHRLGIALSSFYDFAWVSFSQPNPRNLITPQDNERLLLGLGLGIRFLIDRVFLFRMDLATSPQERKGPFLYAVMGSAF